MSTLTETSAPLHLLPLLQTKTFGRSYHYLATTSSTNAELAKLAAEGAAEGTVVVAEQQQAGRGRMARGWFSPPNAGLYFSILLRPKVEVAQIATLLKGMERDYALWQQDGFGTFLERFHVRDALLGRSITVERATDILVGVAEGVNEDGSLRLHLANGRIESVYSGDAHVTL